LLLSLVLGSFLIPGIGILYYIDIPSAIIVLLGGYLVALMSHGPSGIAEAYRTATRGGVTADAKVIGRSRAVLRGLGRNFIYLSILGMIMGLIAVLSLFDPPDTFAQGLATLIITPLYAMMGNILLVNPFLHRLDAMDGVLN
jgi:flagellar motor component MotA